MTAAATAVMTDTAVVHNVFCMADVIQRGAPNRYWLIPVGP
ncbi:hypothetical protein [Streptomyces sp. NPDC002133]